MAVLSINRGIWGGGGLLGLPVDSISEQEIQSRRAAARTEAVLWCFRSRLICISVVSPRLGSPPVAET